MSIDQLLGHSDEVPIPLSIIAVSASKLTSRACESCMHGPDLHCSFWQEAIMGNSGKQNAEMMRCLGCSQAWLVGYPLWKYSNRKWARWHFSAPSLWDPYTYFEDLLKVLRGVWWCKLIRTLKALTACHAALLVTGNSSSHAVWKGIVRFHMLWEQHQDFLHGYSNCGFASLYHIQWVQLCVDVVQPRLRK